MIKHDPLKIIYYILLALLLYCAILPVFSVILYGVFPFESFNYLIELFNRSLPYLQNSLTIAIIVTIISTIIGLSAAIALCRYKFFLNKTLRYGMLLTLINPPFVSSISFIMLFGRRGLITHGLLGLDVSPFGPVGIIVMQVLGFSTLAYLIISSAIVKIDPTIEDAARNMGASECNIFRNITLKTMLPEISTAATLVFLASMADFSTPLVIGGPYHTLASDLYIQITGVYDMKAAAVSGILLLLPCIILFMLQRNFISKKTYYSLNVLNPNINYTFYNKHIKRILIAITCIYTFLVAMKFGFIIIGAFTKKWGYDYTFTFEHFSKVLDRDLTPFLNSIQLAFFVALFASLLGVLLSYIIKRKKFKFRKTADLIATLPAAVPGILLGIGYLVTFKYPLLGIGRFYLQEVPGIILLGTGIIIYIICIFRFMNVGLRSGYAVIEHLNPDIEDAARDLGQKENKIFTQIALPLMAPAFKVAFFKNFSSTMTTLGAIIFLLLPANKVAIQQIFQIINSSGIGVAAVMALFLSTITAICMFIFKIIITKILKVK